MDKRYPGFFQRALHHRSQTPIPLAIDHFLSVVLPILNRPWGQSELASTCPTGQDWCFSVILDDLLTRLRDRRVFRRTAAILTPLRTSFVFFSWSTNLVYKWASISPRVPITFRRWCRNSRSKSTTTALPSDRIVRISGPSGLSRSRSQAS